LYIQEVDDLVNNRVRNKLGTTDFNGDQITLPLTVTGEPPIDEELKAIATDLVIGKIRLQNSEKPLIWDTAIKNLDNYLDRRFGYTRDIPFRQFPQAIVIPAVGTRGIFVTLSGEKWGKNLKLTFQFEGIEVETNPAIVITDANGRFENVTFKIPNTATVNQTSTINITDSQGFSTTSTSSFVTSSTSSTDLQTRTQAKQLKFTVIPFTISLSMDGVVV